MAEAGGLEVGDDVAHVLGAQQLAAVRHARQPGVAGDAESGRPLGGLAPPLVVAQPEPHHLPGGVAGVLGREPRQRPGVQRVPGAGGRHDHADLDARGRARGAGLVQDDLQGRREAADEGRVRRRVDLDLEAARALGGVVLSGLAHDPAHRGLRAHDGARGVVGALEPEPAALGGRDPQRVGVGEGGGQAHALLGSELPERRDPHRAREVQVQVSLRQGDQIAHLDESATPVPTRPPGPPQLPGGAVGSAGAVPSAAPARRRRGGIVVSGRGDRARHGQLAP